MCAGDRGTQQRRDAAGGSNTNFNGITPEIKEILDECPDSAKTGYVYYSEETHKMEPELLKTWEAFADKYTTNR